MKKTNKNKKKKKAGKKLLIEKQYNESKNNRIKIENEINEILDELSVEELTELENMGDFSKEAIEWIRTRKKRKKARKAQEDFEKRLRASDDVIRRTVLIGKLAGLKNGEYKAKNKEEENLLKEILEEQDITRDAREREKEKGDSRGVGGGKQKSRDAR